LMYLVKMNLV